MSAQSAKISNTVELPNSVHQLPTGSKAMRRTSEQRWIELTVGVRRSQQLPDLSSLDDKLPASAHLHDPRSAREQIWRG